MVQLCTTNNFFFFFPLIYRGKKKKQHLGILRSENEKRRGKGKKGREIYLSSSWSCFCSLTRRLWPIRRSLQDIPTKTISKPTQAIKCFCGVFSLSEKKRQSFGGAVRVIWQTRLLYISTRCLQTYEPDSVQAGGKYIDLYALLCSSQDVGGRCQVWWLLLLFFFFFL